MEYNKLVSITGLTGLYELLSSKTDGAIVRSLDDNSTKFMASRIHNFSHLESIEVYTLNENVNLVEIFKAMEKSPEPLPDSKSSEAVKKYFQKVYPEIDFERVYASDMKKMVKWFDVLRNKVEFKLSTPEDEETADEETTGEKQTEEKPADQQPVDQQPADQQPAGKQLKDKQPKEKSSSKDPKTAEEKEGETKTDTRANKGLSL